MIVVNHTDEVTRDQIASTLDGLGWTEIPQEQNNVEYDEPSIWGCAL
jgi:hypothetical protein